MCIYNLDLIVLYLIITIYMCNVAVHVGYNTVVLTCINNSVQSKVAKKLAVGTGLRTCTLNNLHLYKLIIHVTI